MDWIPSDWVDWFNNGPGGLIEAILALSIAGIGFIFTYRAARKSKTAAEAAEEAVIETRKDMRKVDAVSDLMQAVAIMEEIKTLHRQQAWILLPSKYSIVRQLLISVRAANPNLSSQHKENILNALVHFETMEKQVEQALYKNEEPPSVPKLNEITSKQKDKLSTVLGELQSSIGV